MQRYIQAFFAFLGKHKSFSLTVMVDQPMTQGQNYNVIKTLLLINSWSKPLQVLCQIGFEDHGAKIVILEVFIMYQNAGKGYLALIA